MKGVKKRKVSPVVWTAILFGVILFIFIFVIFVAIKNISFPPEPYYLPPACEKIYVNAISADCSNPSACVVTLERTGKNKEEMGGVKLVFKDKSTGTSSGVIDVPGNIEPSLTKTVTVDTNLTSVNRIYSSIYHLDSNGNIYICYTGTFDF